MDTFPMEAPRTPPPGKSQPIEQLASSGPELDDNEVRAAIAMAEANNQDPMTIKTNELASQAPVSNPPPKVEVPEKFLKPDGAVDVEKITASTRQLDEAIAKKEEAVSKSVDDYMREYNERQTKFRTLPNPERLAERFQAPAPAPAPVPVQAEIAPQNFEEIVRADYAADPLGTTTRLLELMLQKKFQPIEEREQAQKTRENLQSLASKDPRVLREDVFAAINAKLQADPDLWKLKQPHRAAWLEVKEEMRLGEPSSVQAQPSRPSPVLGGGTPPSAPSASVNSPQNVIGSLHTLDLRDKKQEAAGDEAIRALLASDRG